jgi:tetratricopeptide (TPR) repeat protein
MIERNRYFFISLICTILTGFAPVQTIDDVKKGVVKIEAQSEGKRRVGTGFIVKLEKNAAYIVTASHVIEGDARPRISFFTQPNTPFTARTIGLEGGDPRGLAALSVNGEIPQGLLALDLDTTVQLNNGDAIASIGFPQASGVAWAVTKGHLSGTRGKDIVFSPALEEGNSGGPLIKDGKVIGVVTEVSGQYGYATPASIVVITLKGWLNPPPEDPFGDTRKKISELLEAAKLPTEAGDYAGAWKLTEQARELAKQARELQPDLSRVQETQIQLAMRWLRNIRVSQGQTFTEIVDKLLPCLYLSVAPGKGSQSADSFAHIGWANYLKQKEGIFGLEVEKNYHKAIDLDAENPYAHAMWGHWILRNSDSDRYEEASSHFSAALKSGRDKEFVRSLQLYALENARTHDRLIEEMIRVLDQMRKNQEPLELDRRHDIEGYIYFLHRREVLDKIASILTPVDHLATYVWLIRDLKDDDLRRRFFVARLTEATGDLSKALSLYRSLRAERGFEWFTLKQETEQGIERCQSPSVKVSPDRRRKKTEQR